MSQEHSRPIWLQDARSDWSIKRIKHSTYLKARVGWHGLTSIEYLEEGSFLVTGTDFEDGRVNWATCHRVSEERYQQDPYIQLKEGDLLITKDGTIGKVALVEGLDESATLNSGVFVTRPLKGIYTNHFMYWLLQSRIFQSFIDYIKVGTTINHLYQNQLSDFAFPVPNLEIQQAIASFLDRKTAAIATLIAKKQRLIQLLEEKRIALIHQTVTKGLNPNVPMKDSGIPWIGEIPEHWEVIKLKYLLKDLIDAEHKTAAFYPDGEYLVVRTTNVRRGKLVLEGAKYTNLDGFLEWTKRGKPQPGDILFTREAPSGEVCVVPDNSPLCLGQRMVLFRVNQNLLNGEFGVYSLYGGLADKFIKSLSQGSTVAHFNMSDIGNIPILTPPVGEQTQITDHLDRATGRMSFLIEKSVASIDKLQEYRQSLITAAVTGKINVREEMAA